MTWTILNILQSTEDFFKKHAIKSPRVDAEVLLSHVLSKRRIDLYLEFERTLTQDELNRYRSLVQRRKEHEPIQYILGKQEFWSLDFKVGPGVLIPRPETECLIEKALGYLKNIEHPSILDIGSGSGIIPIVLAKEVLNLKAVAVDVSDDALAFSRTNAQTHGVTDRITFLKGDLFSNISTVEKFDLILSNPPYVSKDSSNNQIERQVKDYEPSIALFASQEGMEFHKKILCLSKSFLKQDGKVLLEIDPNQASHLKEYLIKEKLFSNIEIYCDLEGRERVLIAS